MTRIYFKPQSCSVRNPRARKTAARGNAHLLHQQYGSNSSKEDGHSSNWRNQLDPLAIEQIADGLEKMVLSWTQSSKIEDALLGNPNPNPTSHHAASDAINDKDEGLFVHSPERSFFVTPNNGSLSAMAPALEEMMRGELIKNWPSITNGESAALVEQTHSDSTYWYLTPAKSLPHCIRATNGNTIQDATTALYRAISPLDINTNGRSAIEMMHQKTPENGCGDTKELRTPRKGPRIQNMEEVSDSDKEAAQEEDCQPENISYHIKTAGLENWSETIEINGGNRITQLLGKKLKSVNSTASYPPLIEDKGDHCEVYRKKVEELQIALLECAMEYEVKIVEMKMQMLHMKFDQHQQKDGDNTSKPASEKSGEVSLHENDHQHERTKSQKLEYLRKQLCKLQREKLTACRELNELRKRERQFDLQRRSLDDALGRVNALQRELAKREQEIVDCQLREKEVRAQLYELQHVLQRTQTAQIEPRKLLSLLPALREWLQTIKKVPYEPASIECVDKTIMPRAAPVDSVVWTVTKEIQALQKALSKLASKK